MTAPRKEEVTLYCEDRDNGRTARLVEAALQKLGEDAELFFAKLVRPRGSSSKNDVHVWTKFTRSQKLRAVGLRDRDFLLRGMLESARRSAFHESPLLVKPWPLPRHCIESYLLDEDVVRAALPDLGDVAFGEVVEQRAAARYWLDVARGTIEDFLWRWRNVARISIDGRPADREGALAATHASAEQIRQQAAEDGTDELLDKHFAALAVDMASDGPLRCRVDGRELVRDVATTLGGMSGVRLPRGGLLAALTNQAEKQCPAALLSDLRDLLIAVPRHWQKD